MGREGFCFDFEFTKNFCSQIIVCQYIYLFSDTTSEEPRVLPCPFLKIERKVLWFCKKYPDCVLCSSIDWIPQLKSCLKVSRRKNSEIPPPPFLLYIVDEIIIKVPLFQKTSPALKNSCLHRCCSLISLVNFVGFCWLWHYF